MTTKKQPLYDFDSWTPEAEDAAIHALAEASRGDYIIVGDEFVGRFRDGTIRAVKVRVTLDQIDQVTGASADEQVDALLRAVGDEDTADFLRGRDMAEAMWFAKKYLSVFERVNRVVLGE